MKYRGLFILTLFQFITLSAGAIDISNKPPLAREGIIDCRSWNFSEDGIIRIKGEAEFYWQKLLGPEDFQSGTALPVKGTFAPGRPHSPGAAVFLNIPSAWNSGKNSPYAAFGFGTYRVTLLLPDDMDVLGIYMSNQDSSYRLFINGRETSVNGRVGASREEYLPKRIPKTLYVPVMEGRAELIIQVANFDHHWGGLNNGILLGYPEQIAGLNRLYLAFFQVLLGGFFLLFLYHAIAFRFRTSDKAHLYISLFTLVLCLRILFTGEYLGYQYFPFLPWALGLKYEYISMPLFVFFFALFLRALVPKDLPQKVLKLIMGFTFFVTVLICILPARFSTLHLTIPVQISTFLCGGVLLFFLLLAINRKRPGAALMAMGITGLLFTAGWDLLAWNRVLPPRIVGPMMYPGFLFFVLMNSLVLSRRMAADYARLDYLSADLEREVADRTRELKEKAEEQLHFFIHLSHEIKTPLTLIINYFSSYTERQGMSRELEIIKTNLDRLLSDIINFFDIFRWSRGQNIYIHDQTSDFSGLLCSKISLLSSSFKKKNLTIYTEISEPLLLKADPAALERLILNLLDNSVKYSRDGGTIRVRAVTENNDLVFSVEDTGPGIPEKNLSDIFLPYFRVTQSGERIEGLGVGLAVVKRITESLSGSIDCTRVPEGGSLFTVRVPLSPEPASAGVPVPVEKIDTYSGNKFSQEQGPEFRDCILIVEDDPQMRDLLFEGLKYIYGIQTADDGKTALDKLKEIRKPSLIICDVMMKEIGGYELLNILKDDPRYRGIPFLLCTARGYDEEAAAAYESGALDFIYKPFVMAELKAKVRSLLRFAGLKEELARKERFLSYGTVLAGLAHEIKNPLSGISGPLGVVKKYFLDNENEIPAQLIKHFAYIEDNIRQINKLTENLKDLYSENRLILMDISLQVFIKDILKTMEIPEGIRVITDIPPEYSVKAHEFILKLSLAQVLKNSINALAGGGKIRIYTPEKEFPAAVIIEDNGPGIDEDTRDRIFEPFFTTRAGLGMGLGLTLARSLLQKIGWNIEYLPIDSGGACFKIGEGPNG